MFLLSYEYFSVLYDAFLLKSVKSVRNPLKSVKSVLLVLQE